MLRVEVQTSLAKSFQPTRGISTHTFPVTRFNELANLMDVKSNDKFPMNVTIKNVDDSEDIVSYLVFVSEDTLNSSDDPTAEGLGKMEKVRKCCFLRGIEDLYLRFTSRIVRYRPDMTYEEAMQERKIALGPNALRSFCWNTDDVGEMTWDKTGFRIHPSFSIRLSLNNFKVVPNTDGFQLSSTDAEQIDVSVSEQVNAAVKNTSESVPVATKVPPSSTDGEQIDVSVSEQVNVAVKNTSESVPVATKVPPSSTDGEQIDVSVSEQVTSQKVRDKYNISHKVTISDRMLNTLSTGDYVKHGQEHVIHPNALLVIKFACDYDNLGEAAEDWCVRNITKGAPVLSITKELETFVHDMNSERLRHLYVLSGDFPLENPEDVRCELCDDRFSHTSEWCARYCSYEARLMLLKTSGSENGTLSQQILSGKNNKYWKEFQSRMISLFCLAKATATWTEKDMDSVATFQKCHPEILRNI